MALSNADAHYASIPSSLNILNAASACLPTCSWSNAPKHPYGVAVVVVVVYPSCTFSHRAVSKSFVSCLFYAAGSSMPFIFR
jgi:hypothetical protein